MDNANVSICARPKFFQEIHLSSSVQAKVYCYQYLNNNLLDSDQLEAAQQQRLERQSAEWVSGLL